MAQKKHAAGSVTDELWATTIPSPLPAVGAKVRVTGHYGQTFTRASSGMDLDRRNGILSYDTMTTTEPAPAALKLPQLN
jgi:hypothetical protein